MGGGYFNMGGGSPSAPPPRNLTKEMTQTLAGYQATAPGYLALTQQYAPQFAGIDLSLAKQYAPQYLGLSLGQQQQAISGSPLLKELNAEAQSGLATGGKLTPQDVRDVTQQTRAGFAARGNVMGNQALGAELLNRDAFSRQRLQQAQQFASGVQGLDLSTLQGLGGVAGPGYALGATKRTQSIYDPMPQYSQDLFNTNYNAQAAANIAGANKNASTSSGALSAAGTIAGAALIASDKRFKEKIRSTGEKTAEGIPIKEFNYRGDKRRFRGVLAQDVEKKMPDAVQTLLSGHKLVDMSKIAAPFYEV